jgi:hypothetical protein
MNENTDIKDVQSPVITDTMYIKSGKTTVKVISHFSGERTYEDIIKSALKREFSN